MTAIKLSKTRKDNAWVRIRIKQVGLTPSDLSGALELPLPRVYDFWKRNRQIRPKDRPAICRLLRLTNEQLTALENGAPLQSIDNLGAPPLTPWARELTGNAVPVWRATIMADGRWKIVAERSDALVRPDFLRFSKYAFALTVLDANNVPVFEVRDSILIDPDRPPMLGEMVCLGTDTVTSKAQYVMVGRLEGLTERHVTLRQEKMPEGKRLQRSKYPGIWPVTGRYIRA